MNDQLGRDEIVRRFAAMHHTTSEAVARAASSLIEAFQPIAEVARKFGDAIYALAEQSYLDAHSTLPGSNRTSRLRKKRRTMVLSWFRSELQSMDATAPERW